MKFEQTTELGERGNTQACSRISKKPVSRSTFTKGEVVGNVLRNLSPSCRPWRPMEGESCIVLSLCEEEPLECSEHGNGMNEFII